MLVSGGKATHFDGDLDDYASWVTEQRVKDKMLEAAQAEPTEKKNNYAQNKLDRQTRIAERRPLVRESEKLEKDIATWQEEKVLCDEHLNNTAIYESSDKAELQALLKQQSALTLNIEQAEERWLTVQEKLEAIPVINA